MNNTEEECLSCEFKEEKEPEVYKCKLINKYIDEIKECPKLASN